MGNPDDYLKTCPVCRRPLAKEARFVQDSVENLEYACSTCGHFATDRMSWYNLRKLEARYQVSAVLREASIRKRPLAFSEHGEPPDLPGYSAISFDELSKSRFPGGFAELIDRAVLNFASLSSFRGDHVRWNFDENFPLIFAQNREEGDFHISALCDAGLLDFHDDLESGIGLEAKFYKSYSLTRSGWLRVAELQYKASLHNSDQAFVAMWFGSSEKSFQQDHSSELRSSRLFCAEVYRDGLAAAVADAGYRPYRVDFDEFNDDVVDQIIAGIRGSRFLIADFTGHRNGVYFEAGYARGMNIPVIHTCHSKVITEAHFDTRNFNHVTWNDAAELRRKLTARIIATIGRGPNPPVES